MKTYEFNWVQTSQETEKKRPKKQNNIHPREANNIVQLCGLRNLHINIEATVSIAYTVNSDVSLQPKLL